MIARTNNGSHHHAESHPAPQPLDRTHQRWIRGVSAITDMVAVLVLVSCFLVGAFTVLRSVWRLLFTS